MFMKPKSVLITGASSGIGRELAIEFYKNNHNVVLFARRKEKLEILAQELKDIPSKASVVVIAGDATQIEDIKQALKETIHQLGRIDILINNAGAGLNSFFEDLEIEEAKKLMDLNFFGLLSFSQEALPYMKKQGCGQIVNISSIAGKRGLPSRSIYSASKFAVEGLTEGIRVELEPENIHFTLVRPTSTQTEFFDVEPKGNSYLDQRDRARMTAKQVAQIAYKGILKKKKVITISFHGKLAVVLNTLFPNFTDWIISKVFSHLKKVTVAKGDSHF